MAKGGKYININYPFKDSDNGFFLELNNNDSNAIKADLMHLILTNKGERLYNPEFGTNLLKFIFEPNDGITQSEIKVDIQDTVKRYLPNLAINEVTITPVESNEHLVSVRIDYTVTEDVFQETDFIVIQI